MAKRYNANGGQGRSKSFRISVPKDLVGSIRCEVYRQQAIKEFGKEIVERLDAEYPDRMWDKQAIEWLRELLKEK